MAILVLAAFPPSNIGLTTPLLYQIQLDGDAAMDPDAQ